MPLCRLTSVTYNGDITNVKITKVVPNNRKKAFEIQTRGKDYVLPYAVLTPAPTQVDRVRDARVDDEMGKEGFVYSLESGDEGAVHIDHVLEFNRDPGYMADALLYKLTLWAQEAVEKSPFGAREIIRRLGTSPAQYYRLLDQTNYGKSMRQLLKLLQIVDCEVDVVMRSQVADRQDAGVTP